MGKRWCAAALAASVWIGGVLPVTADEGVPADGKDPQAAFQNVPEAWRAYFLQAHAAERHADWLQRCLAYPDLPGNKWPAGHAEAHCRYHAAGRIEVEEVDGYLQRGEVAALQRRLDGLLARHFSEDDFGEDIDAALETFYGADADADRVSERWLALAPESAYAHLARANHLRGRAGAARGGAWAQKTPKANFRRMEDLLVQAIPFYRTAIRLEPRLMPAYAGLLNSAMLGSMPGVEREALAGAKAQDPACVEVARRRMNALEPRWGGSYEEMLSFGAELSRHVPRRPQLAIHVSAPYRDRADMLVSEDAFTRETMALLDIATRIGSEEGALHQAGNVALNLTKEEGGADPWKATALLLQEQRFNHVNAWAHRQIAWHVLRLDPAWSLRHAQRAGESEPDVAFGRFLLGAGYSRTGEFDKAEPHYIAAAEDDGNRLRALGELATMWLYRAGLPPEQAAAKAGPYVDRFLQAFPDHGPAWLVRLDQLRMQHGRMDLATVRGFMRHADSNEPWQAARVAELESELKRLGVPPEQWRP